MAFVPVGDVPVDFDKQMVLFVTMGQVYSDAYGIRIDRVWQHDHQLKVGITISAAGAGGDGGAAALQPVFSGGGSQERHEC